MPGMYWFYIDVFYIYFLICMRLPRIDYVSSRKSCIVDTLLVYMLYIYLYNFLEIVFFCGQENHQKIMENVNKSLF